jgi:hypothetical protein
MNPQNAYFVARQSRLKLDLGLLVCVLGVTGGVVGLLQKSDNPDAPGIAIFVIVSFSLLGSIYLKQAIWPAELRFTPGGLDARLVLRRMFWPWNQVKGAHLQTHRGVTHVIVEMADGQRHGLTGAWRIAPAEVAARILDGVERFGGGRPANRPIVE